MKPPHDPSSAENKKAEDPAPTDADLPATAVPARTVEPRLLELLVCPLTKTSLDYDAERGELISRRARLAFPIRDGVPLLVEEAARPLDGDTEG